MKTGLGKKDTGRPANSFLVRVWLEPREGAGQRPCFRAYLRDLETGEERYVADPRHLVDGLLRDLREALADASEQRPRHRDRQ